MEDDANICSRCGTQYVALQSVQPEQAVNNAGVYQQPQYQPYQQPYGQGYQQPYAAPAEAPMSVGSWVGTILLTTCLGIISIILLLVWAFSNDVNIAKKNYCRAMLIVYLIGIGLAIIFSIVFAAVIASAWDEISSSFSDFSQYFK